MKSANSYFSPQEQAKIEASVQAVEAKTSGEIVPMLVDASYEYPRAELIGGGSLALATASLVSWLFGGESIWWFLPFFICGFFLFQQLIRLLPGLRRRLIHPDEMTTEVEEKARVSFVENGLHQTRDHTGILILISLFERRVHILADSGINAQVPQETWDEIVTMITAGLKSGNACAALCQAIDKCGDLLEESFPVKADDTNELPNLIIEEK